MKRNIKGSGLLLAGAILWCGTSYGQTARNHLLSPQADGYLERGRAMYEGGNYTGAADQLRHLMTEGAQLQPDETRELAYLMAMAAYERGDAACEDLLAEFTARYPSAPTALEATLALGDWNLFGGRYADALDIYDSIDSGRLNAAQRPLYTFRKAFCLIRCGEFESARSLLRSIRYDSGYKTAAEFYIAYIDYAQGDYRSAYDGFSAVARMPKSMRVADDYHRSGAYMPTGLDAEYYLVQIAYRNGDYRQVTADGRSLLAERGPEELRPETEKVVGLSYFKLDDYSQARRYLTDYFRDTPGAPSDDAVYAMGVIEYAEGDYERAGSLFSSISGLRSDLGQSAMLYLGQIAARDGDDNAAAIAFEKAAGMDFDHNVGESALYNYVAARTRGGSIPFSSSISLLERFLQLYPDSEFAPVVEEHMATAYYNEKDYAKALQSIERIKNPGKRVLAAKQKVTYELGIESLSNNRPAEAQHYLETAVSLSQYNRDLALQAQLWLGDALYAQRKWKQAENAYKKFIDGTGRDSNHTLALYNLAYALYMQDSFKQAAQRFKQAADASPALPDRLAADARMRLADCQYYTGDYRSAMNGYAEASKRGGEEADYAAYRHAVMRGLGGDIKGKITELNAMASRFPSSRWIPAAILEKGMTYNGLGQTADATKAFEELTSRYPSSPYARKGMLNLAMAYNKASQTGKATETYREVIRNWPSSEEASVANEDLQRHYASTGELDEYSDFLSEIPDAPRLGDDEKERLTFEAAETAFARDEKASRKLEEYADRYPNGRYLAQALLDLAESYDAQGSDRKALGALERLLSRRGDSPQAPEALAMRAEILEREPASRNEALQAWKELERRADNDFLPDAYAGIMRTTSSEQERMKYARLALQSGGLSADMADEAYYYEAVSMRDSGDRNGAEKVFRRLAANPKSLSGAKAAVALGQMQLDSRQLKQAEKTLTEFTDAGTPHQYWLARGFIALADTYHAMGKDYLAKEYVTSLRDNYPGDELDIHDMISKRLKSWK